MGYGKSKPAVFKMKHQGVKGLAAALQNNPDKKGKKMVGTKGTKETKDAGVTYYADKGKSIEGGPSENQRGKDSKVYAKSHGASRPSSLSFKEARDFSSAEAAFDRKQARTAAKKGRNVKNPSDQKKLMKERSRRSKA